MSEMWPDALKTQDLLEQARGGDDEAVNALFGRHRESVRRLVAYQMDPALARRLDASDIVQDVLVEASRRLADYLRDPALPFHLWLRQLAKDHLIGAYRRHRLAKKRSVDRERALHAPAYGDASSMDLAAQIAANGVTPATQAMRRELLERFVEALETLADTDREIINMRHIEQLSNQDAALALGISEAAAGMRHVRALRKLREVLGGD